jgi:hypothetical protein
LSVAYEVFGSYDSTWAHVWAVAREHARYDDWKRQADEGLTTVLATRFEFEPGDDEAALTLLKLSKRWSIHALDKSIAELGLDVESDA